MATSTTQQAIIAPRTPILYHDLRQALSFLYSLHGQEQHHHAQYHEFLMHFQGRNVKRKLQSQRQSQADLERKGIGAADGMTYLLPTGEILGSSWLASVHVLASFTSSASSSPAVHTSERLFAAQTLLHRVRRVKLGEAIDIELEARTVQEVFHLDWERIVTLYCGTLLTNNNQHPEKNELLLQRILMNFIQKRQQEGLFSAQDEDRIKGEIALQSIAAVAYINAVYLQSIPQDQQWQGQSSSSIMIPLLSTLGACMATIALKVRYTPKQLYSKVGGQQQQQVQQQHSLTAMIIQAFSFVHEQVASSTRVGHDLPYYVCICACLAAIPDTILGSSGGARARLSIDPKCLVAAGKELRNASSSIALVWQVLHSQIPRNNNNGGGGNNLSDQQESMARTAILMTCERWAKYVALPLDFLRNTLPLVVESTTNMSSHTAQQQGQQQEHLAWTYVIAILEGGAWSEDHILAVHLGLEQQQAHAQQAQQTTKKRQSSKSKKKHNQKMMQAKQHHDETQQHAQDHAATPASLVAAEHLHRGEAAWETTAWLWTSVLDPKTRASLSLQDQYVNSSGDGEGPIGTVCACANACLPFVLRYHSISTGSEDDSRFRGLVQKIMTLFQLICQSSQRIVRALTYEPLLNLHAAFIKHHDMRISQTGSNNIPGAMKRLDITWIERAIVEHFFSCCMHLASECAYPLEYFNDMASPNDEPLEVERNDVRDVLRTLCGMGKDKYVPPSMLTVELLHNILEACVQALESSISSATPITIPETAVHAFSALAKPFNHLALAFQRNELDTKDPLVLQTIQYAFSFIRKASLSLVELLLQTSVPISSTFAACRLSQMAVASYAPAFEAMLVKASNPHDPAFKGARLDIASINEIVRAALRAALMSAIKSVDQIPEMFAESTLGTGRYDVVGAFRGPGGEDHVGILVFMRMADEGPLLAQTMTQVEFSNEHTSMSLLSELCRLHAILKTAELRRRPGVMHGSGVTPKSRRILLGTMSKLVATQMASTDDNANAESRMMLEKLFFEAVSTLPSNLSIEGTTPQQMFQVCEATFDIAAFGAHMVSALFVLSGIKNEDQIRQNCVQFMIQAGCFGYSIVESNQNSRMLPSTDLLFHWGRLRAAQMTLVMAMNNDCMGSIGHALVEELVRSECNAIVGRLSNGPNSSSIIFNENIISDAIVNAGAVVYAVGESLQQMAKDDRQRQGPLTLDHFANLLGTLSGYVLPTILHDCPEATGFLDPRLTLCEAWFFTAFSLVGLLKDHGSADDWLKCQGLLSSTSCVAVRLFLNSSLGNRDDRMHDKGMSMDGPHTLTILDFLGECFPSCYGVVESVSLTLSKEIQTIFPNQLGTTETHAARSGIATLGASLLRAASGGLPPWAVEKIPSVFAGIFSGVHGMREDPSQFGMFLSMSMQVRLSSTTTSFGGVEPGALLCGSVLESLSNQLKEQFVRESIEILSNDRFSWNRFKGVLKRACGGKKKDSGFDLKPSPTNWECDRI